MRRFACLTTFAAALLIAAAPGAFAAETMAYSAAALQHAEAEGKPIIVHVTASWCSTCAAQKPIVTKLLKDPKYKDLVLLHVDFDSQKSVLRRLGVQAQSTFVAFKGKQEVARSTGDTDKGDIEALFDKAM